MRSFLGIRLRLHYTCGLACALLSVVVATQMPGSYSYLQKAGLGLATAALYLMLLLIREYVLNLATGRGKVPAKDITLFAMGGVCRTNDELTLPGHELLMAAARFLSTLTIAVLAYGFCAIAINAGNLTMANLTEWLTYIWGSLFLMHLLPGFPLDAGMVLRAFLLKRFGSIYRSTYASSTAGWAIGLVMIFSGVLSYIITQQWLAALVTTVLGWCLQSAAGVLRRHAALTVALEYTRVGNVMSGEYLAVDKDTTISQILKEQILVSGWRHFVVTEGGVPQGVLSPRGIKAVSWKRWGSTRAGEVMTPLSMLEAAYPAQSGADAIEEMDRQRLEEMPVVDCKRVIGVISREQLVNLGKTRAEFRQ
jgi:Zn-dependent protease